MHSQVDPKQDIKSTLLTIAGSHYFLEGRTREDLCCRCVGLKSDLYCKAGLKYLATVFDSTSFEQRLSLRGF